MRVEARWKDKATCDEPSHKGMMPSKANDVMESRVSNKDFCRGPMADFSRSPVLDDRSAEELLLQRLGSGGSGSRSGIVERNPMPVRGKVPASACSYRYVHGVAACGCTQTDRTHRRTVARTFENRDSKEENPLPVAAVP